MKEKPKQKTGAEFFDRVLIALITGEAKNLGTNYGPDKRIGELIKAAETITKARGKFLRDKIKQKEEKDEKLPAKPKADGAIDDLDDVWTKG